MMALLYLASRGHGEPMQSPSSNELVYLASLNYCLANSAPEAGGTGRIRVGLHWGEVKARAQAPGLASCINQNISS